MHIKQTISQCSAAATVLSKPLQLPCGAVLKNRIVKACMSDSLGNGQGCPTPPQIRLYERWAQGGVALSCVGEVQVDGRYPEKPGNLVLSMNEEMPKEQESLFRELTRRATIHGTHLWAQLGHAGALTPLAVNPTPKGPSALNLAELKCEGLSMQEIQQLPSLYAGAATQAKRVGFTGVMIHAGHGFLLSQFLSPLFNRRSDDYGIKHSGRLILEILTAIREAVGSNFPIGIRLNSSDLLEGGLTQEGSLEVVKLLDATTIDLIDISGGTYFPGAKSAGDGTGKKGPYFLDFCRRARKVTSKPLVLTGGFKKRRHAIDVLEEGAADGIGIARAFVMNPSLANDWITTPSSSDNHDTVDPKFPRFQETVPGGITAWFTMRLTAIGMEQEESFEMDLATAMRKYEERDAQRYISWRQRFFLKAPLVGASKL